MGSWKRYHEVMAIVSAGDCAGGKIIGGILWIPITKNRKESW